MDGWMVVYTHLCTHKCRRGSTHLKPNTFLEVLELILSVLLSTVDRQPSNALWRGTSMHFPPSSKLGQRFRLAFYPFHSSPPFCTRLVEQQSVYLLDRKQSRCLAKLIRAGVCRVKFPKFTREHERKTEEEKGRTRTTHCTNNLIIWSEVKSTT